MDSSLESGALSWQVKASRQMPYGAPVEGHRVGTAMTYESFSHLFQVLPEVQEVICGKKCEQEARLHCEQLDPSANLDLILFQIVKKPASKKQLRPQTEVRSLLIHRSGASQARGRRYEAIRLLAPDIAQVTRYTIGRRNEFPVFSVFLQHASGWRTLESPRLCNRSQNDARSRALGT